MGQAGQMIGKDAASADSDAARHAATFATYARAFRPQVEASLESYLVAAAETVAALPADVQATADTVRNLALRGGKRLRAVLMAAAYDACGGEGGAEKVVLAGVSLELLQVYLLIHDDWMDGDDVRRGGPSVPAMLRTHFAGRGRKGAASADGFAILAGDLAAGYALDALARVPLPAPRVLAATLEMGRIQRDVVLGQLCDLQGELSREAPSEEAVEVTHRLKTGSYTVRGPLALGAHLAGADAATLAALAAFAEPLGVAFQLRDDVLGTFGDPKRTGKPSTGDLRQGKRTALIAALARGAVDPAVASVLEAGFGRADAAESDVDALADRIVSSGAKARVEQRIDALLAEALWALDRSPLPAPARDLLRGAAHTLGHRDN